MNYIVVFLIDNIYTYAIHDTMHLIFLLSFIFYSCNINTTDIFQTSSFLMGVRVVICRKRDTFPSFYNEIIDSVWFWGCVAVFVCLGFLVVVLFWCFSASVVG